MGLIYFEKGNYDDAILEFSFVLASNPKDDKVRYYLATAYLKGENHDQAIAEYLKIPPESTLYVDSRENAALILEDLGKSDEAIDLLDRSIRIKPKDTGLYLLLSSFYERGKQVEKALEVLTRAHQFDEKNTDLLFQMGIIYDKLGKFEEMVRRMREVISLNPEYANALNYLGYSFADKGIHLDEALELVQKALKLKPDSGYITDSLGWVYYKKGEYKRAITQLEKAIELTPDDPIITEHLGDGYLKVNLPKKALELYERALQLKPKEDQLNRLRKKIKEIKAKKGVTP
jgi:tetratricopeptide (TPR) repeat protein